MMMSLGLGIRIKILKIIVNDIQSLRNKKYSSSVVFFTFIYLPSTLNGAKYYVFLVLFWLKLVQSR